ncbi:MAG: flippase-like domain-containing protein [Blastocatellia bacterium]|nr:flippase-like domain-containing protein [Blastocatellia bacterium]MCS7157070.1 flippase-like domain-containing protein [Blastocatellia bacterium]MCX7752271.1 flippase-like domain-containing protein [Blastocatellia bacterium]MDW8167763.1 lysylphosphatidylglycerol synthase transmembrane domain-containing protein [Acidobacteriota bacterium]MDW8256584.1 lysylphosphatidylglycerol synthase transmembrane domain-containing protein [Acidobacteriota bacterium]
MGQQDSSLNLSDAQPTKRASWLTKAIFGCLVAAACLVWVFHDVHVERLLDHIVAINWGWVALAIVFDILSYVCQGWRWQLLLKPVGDVSVLRATQAIYAGLFTNEVLPMRFGELVRAYLISRWISARFVAILPSMAVERLFDGVWLGGAIGLTALFVPLPKDLIEAADILGVVVLIATGLFVYAVFRKPKAPTEATIRSSGSWRSPQIIKSFTDHLVSGLQAIGTSRFVYLAFGLSLLFLTLQAFAFWLIMRAYGLPLSFWVGFVVLLIVHLGTAVPNAPANVGTYQFFTVVGLTLFGVEKTLAAGFSVVAFVVLTIPLWIIGFLALSRSGMMLSTIRSEVSKLTVR